MNEGSCITAAHRFRWPWATRPFWLIDAFRVFCKVIARKREGARSRASTQIVEFAITAFCPSSCPIGEAFETAASSGRLPSENSGERFPPKGGGTHWDRFRPYARRTPIPCHH